jgi:hypothetical protein
VHLLPDADEANVRLISAAPELFELLGNADDYLAEIGAPSQALKDLRGAIDDIFKAIDGE